MSNYQDPLLSGFGNNAQVINNAIQPSGRAKGELSLVTLQIERTDGGWNGSITAGKKGLFNKGNTKNFNNNSFEVLTSDMIFAAKKGFKLVPPGAQNTQRGQVPSRGYEQTQQPQYQQPQQYPAPPPPQQPVYTAQQQQVYQYQPVPPQYQPVVPTPPAQVVPVVQAPRICKSCGSTVPQNQVFCGGCGQKYIETPPPAPVVVQAPVRQCKTCGLIVPATQSFCGGCGTKYEAPVPPAPVAAFCGSCGAPNAGSKFCVSCGAKL